MKCFALLTSILLFLSAYSQSKTFTILPLHQKAGLSFRGLSAVSDSVVWVSGSRGTVGRSLDGGLSWKWIQVPDFDSTDFRDIHAFDANTAVIMGIGEPAFILKTKNGGNTWDTVYQNATKGMFLDAMDFYGNRGIVVGDPVDERFFMAVTINAGDSWTELPWLMRPKAGEGEAFFAASGTNVVLSKSEKYSMATGGKVSRFFSKLKNYSLPLVQGENSTGANSIALSPNGKKWLVVGGDFNKPGEASAACFYSTNGGKTWKAPRQSVNGYRSCVSFLSNVEAIACGLNGVDYSCDGGKTWTGISTTGYHVVAKAKNGRAIFFAGGGGRLGKLVVE